MRRWATIILHLSAVMTGPVWAEQAAEPFGRDETGAQPPGFEPVQFALQNGTKVAALRGELKVPENRTHSSSRAIPIRFLRFPSRSKQPQAPIVYLAGGPGGAGTAAAKGRRWAMFDRLRDVSDVIILDQRGTGMSNALPACQAAIEFPADPLASQALFVKLHRQTLLRCAEFWQNEGADYRGYTTWESAADIDAVRQALGAEKVNLLGISYGTHLALATLKRYPNHVDRLVLASAEGLDQTVKLPARTDAYFARLQAAINADPLAAARYPDVRGLIREVLDQVDAEPPQVTRRGRNGRMIQQVITRFDLQLITGGMISDPRRVGSLLEGYVAAKESRGYGYFKWFMIQPPRISGMSELMDIASGISAARLAQVESQAASALLGDALNFPLPHLRDALPDLDLGDEFRAPVRSDRPALFLSGTLDGRTYPESHAELARCFSNGAVVTIKHAGHNLFFSHPDVLERIVDFFAGAPAETRELIAPLPTFVGP